MNNINFKKIFNIRIIALKKIIGLMLVQILLISNIAFAQNEYAKRDTISMLSPQIFIRTDDCALLFDSFSTADNARVESYLSELHVKSIGDELDRVLNSYLKASRKEASYYDAYKTLRTMIYESRFTRDEVLVHLRKKAEAEPISATKKFYLRIWAKFEEDRLTGLSPEEKGYFKPDNMTLLMTRRCNLQCKGCFTESGPDQKQKLSMAQIEKITLQAEKAGVRTVKFMGGELSLIRPEMIFAISTMRLHGITSGSFFTNGWWADTSWARSFLEELRKAYRKRIPPIIISVDKMHQEKIGVEKIRDFINLYLEMFPGSSIGLHSFVSNKEDEVKELMGSLGGQNGEDRYDEDAVSTLQFRLYTLENGRLTVIYEPLLQLGNAKNLPDDYKKRYLPYKRDIQEKAFLKWMVNFSVSNLRNSFAIGADGEFVINSLFVSENMFTMGNIAHNDISEAISYANKNLLFRTIMSDEGPEKVYAIARKLDLFEQRDLENTFFFEEFIVLTLKDPVKRLAVLASMLEDRCVDAEAKKEMLSDYDVDKDFICRSLKEIQVQDVIEEVQKTMEEKLGEYFVRNIHHGLQHSKDLLEKAKQLVKDLGKETEVDWKVLTAAIYLHDLFAAETEFHGEKAAEFVDDAFKENDVFTAKQLDMIKQAVRFHDKKLDKDYSYTGKDVSIEAKILYDVDNLDAFGIKGIYRYFAAHISRGLNKGMGSSEILDIIKKRVAYNVAQRRDNLYFSQSRQISDLNFPLTKMFFDKLVEEKYPAGNKKGATGVFSFIWENFDDMPWEIAEKAYDHYDNQDDKNDEDEIFTRSFFRRLEKQYSELQNDMRVSEKTASLATVPDKKIQFKSIIRLVEQSI